MEYLKSDLKQKQKIFAEDGAQVGMLRILMADGTSANIIYRTMRWFAIRKLATIAYAFQWLNKFVNGCVIGIDADFDKGFVIMHPVGIVINSKVKGGRNITLESGVVIGDEKGRSPLFGHNIFIGSGAKVIGHLTVEDDVKIGANAVLTKNAPSGATMLGVPARPYKQNISKDV